MSEGMREDCVCVRLCTCHCVHVSNAPCWILQKLTWRSGQADREMCAVKGKHRVRIKQLSSGASYPIHSTRDLKLWAEKLAASQNAVNTFCVCFQDECHNFIKVLVPRNDDLVFICGTNGFNPMCRYYRVSVQCQDLLLVRGCITISAFTGRHVIPECASSSAKHVWLSVYRRGRVRADCPLVNWSQTASFSLTDTKIDKSL